MYAEGSVEMASRRVCRMVCSPSSGSSLPMGLEWAITACTRMIVFLPLSRSRSTVYVSSLQNSSQQTRNKN
jgi:hypothetical protein